MNNDILQSLRDEPGTTFEFGAMLPSGNEMIGTIGPIINGTISAQVSFKNMPASEEDVRLAQECLRKLIGAPPMFVSGLLETEADRVRVAQEMRRHMGGGKG